MKSILSALSIFFVALPMIAQADIALKSGEIIQFGGQTISCASAPISAPPVLRVVTLCKCNGNGSTDIGQVNTLEQCTALSKSIGYSYGTISSCQNFQVNPTAIETCNCNGNGSSNLGQVSSLDQCTALAKSIGYSYGTVTGCKFE